MYCMQLPTSRELTRRVLTHIKKTIKVKFRSLNPNEIDRLTATEAFEQVSQSFGVIAIWDSSDALHTNRHNQRTAFVVGLARGLDIPFLLLAEQNDRLPLDFDEIATRWSNFSDVANTMRAFREEVYEAQESFDEIKVDTDRFLDKVYCGDPAAENEAAHLSNYFLETEQFRLTLNGELNILLGRKGSGKTAIFLQARNRARIDKSNIVIDLQPEGYQLVRLKEFISDRLSEGARREFVASFWEYIVWLEIARKLLEKDERRARYDSTLLSKYEQLKTFYNVRVKGSGGLCGALRRVSESSGISFSSG